MSLSYEDRIRLICSVKSAVKSDKTIFNEIIAAMTQGLHEENDKLKKHACAMEAVAVAMHTKASVARHTPQSKAFVDGTIRKNIAGTEGAQFFNIYFEDVLK